jgi:hypothetical protein
MGGGYIKKTYVINGRPAYARVYQERFYHGFAYQVLVPTVVFPAAYYAWAAQSWGRPVVVNWGWQAQPWYATYGASFTPYPAYSSLDQWMTDYVVADNLQDTYQGNPPSPAQEMPTNAAPVAPQNSYAPPPSIADSAPPPVTITAEVKDMENAQIKAHLDDGTRNNTPLPKDAGHPPALWTGHVYFRVTSDSIIVQGAAPGDKCTLQKNDYIKRLGQEDAQDMVTVEVKASGQSDCPQGLKTKVSVGNLMTMENAQRAQVEKALQAARKTPGLPSTRFAETPVREGQTTPDNDALRALNQAG